MTCIKYPYVLISLRVKMNIDKDRFKKLYEKGYNDRQIAEEMGFTIDSISNYRRRKGLPSHRKYCD